MKYLRKLLLILLLNVSVFSAQNKQEVKQKIVEVCKEINAPIPVVMAIAQIESSFNPDAKNMGCYGLFQLREGYGGCIGDDRFDIEKSVRCLHHNHQKLKARWLKEFGAWDDFYHYGIHQKGFTGFKEIYQNRDKLLSEISENRRWSILISKPRKADWERVSDWWDYYEKRFYGIYNQYTNYQYWSPPKREIAPPHFMEKYKLKTIKKHYGTDNNNNQEHWW